MAHNGMFNNIRDFFLYSGLGMKLLWKKSRQQFMLIILNVAVSSVMAFPGMYLLSYSVSALSGETEVQEYLCMVMLFVAGMIGINILGRVLGDRLTYLNNRLKLRLRLDINEICMRMDYQDLGDGEKLKQKGLAQNALNGNSLDLLLQSIGETFSGILIVFGLIYILAEISFLIMVPMGISLLCGGLYHYKNAKTGYIDSQDTVEYRRKNEYIQQVCRDFSFAKDIRLFGMKKNLKKRMDDVDEMLFRLKERRRKDKRFLMVCFILSDYIMEGAIYLYLGWLVLGIGRIGPGEFTLYASALRKMKGTFDNLLETLTRYAVNTQYLKGFFEFTKPSGIKMEGKGLPEKFQTLEFQDVSFHYPGSEKNVLDGINITISRGDSIMLVGENGAGKSTFVKLCCGLYRPTAGKILLNGVDIIKYDPEGYRDYFAVVFQDYRLFAASVRENVASMEDEISDSQIQYALSETGMGDKIAGLKKGDDTQLYRIFDEEGEEFSGGEMQRLAIARALYKKTDFMILDEPLSALDAYNEHKIYDCFRRISDEKTVLFVSHRLSSVKFTNKIVVFECGKIIGEGSHEELMNRCELYSKLYGMQSKLYMESNEDANGRAEYYGV